MSKYASNSKHRPPHAAYKIGEMIKLGMNAEAQRYCDENVEFYREKIEEQHNLYLEAQCAKMGVKSDTFTKLAIADPAKRVTINQTDGIGRAS